MIFYALFLLVVTPVVDWLFPYEGSEYKHYEGHFGATCDHYGSWDEMTRDEKEDSATRMFK